MTELPPIIERLDALKARRDSYSKLGAVQGAAIDTVNAEIACLAIDELRAELLRLQAERDAWLQQHAQDTVRFTKERDELIAELNLRINDAAQLDALLEALKAYAPADWFEALHRDPDLCNPECYHCDAHGCMDFTRADECGETDECIYRSVPHCDLDCPYPAARALIANVEGKDD